MPQLQRRARLTSRRFVVARAGPTVNAASVAIEAEVEVVASTIEVAPVTALTTETFADFLAEAGPNTPVVVGEREGGAFWRHSGGASLSLSY